MRPTAQSELQTMQSEMQAIAGEKFTWALQGATG
jgi:hypothetical protein